MTVDDSLPSRSKPSSRPTNVSIHEFVIPLSPFEKILLDGINTTYISPLIGAFDSSLAQSAEIRDDSSNQEVNFDIDSRSLELQQLRINTNEVVALEIMQLFQRWQWRSDVEKTVLSSQTESELEDWGGDRIESFSAAIHFLKQPDNLHAFRTNLMMEHNDSVFDILTAREPPPQFRFVPLSHDKSYWETLEFMNLWMDLMQDRFRVSPEHFKYEIWKFAQQFSLAGRRPRNAQRVVHYLIRSTMFRDKFVIRKVSARPQDPGDSQSTSTAPSIIWVEIVDRQALLARPETIDPSEGITIPLLRWLFSTLPIDDPRLYVEVIPWEELMPVSASELNTAHVPITLPHEAGTDDSDLKWMLWELPSRHFFDSHHLYTEFEVYSYCVTHDWWFPGHSYRGAVIFALSPLERTEFIKELKHFWEYWNDCALSVGPDGHVYLLETIPGRQYRAKRKRLGESQARHYFRNLIQDHDQRRDSDVQVKAILGVDYKPEYQGVLRPIQVDQFVQVDPEPFAKGANGAVYNAILRQSATTLSAGMPLEPEIAVVLKQTRSEFKGREGVKKILHELSITYIAMEAEAACCVKFLGVCQVWVSRDFQISTSKQSPDAQQKLFLVFRRATEGDLLDFVDRRLRGLDKRKGWVLVIVILSGIAAGLTALHSNGAIHGDLHPANILVTKVNLQGEDEYQFLLADFGQGSRVDDGFATSSSTGRFVCQVGPYIAPEVCAGKSKSFESDAYSFGRIGRKIINLWRWILSESTDKLETIPRDLKMILDQCAAENPVERPKMKLACGILAALQTSMEADEADWVPWTADPQEVLKDRPITSDAGDLSLAEVELEGIENELAYS